MRQHPEVPFMLVDDPLGDGQAQPRAAGLPRTGGVGAVEALKNVWHVLGTDARAVILYGKTRDAFFIDKRAQRDGIALFGKLGGVIG